MPHTGGGGSFPAGLRDQDTAVWQKAQQMLLSCRFDRAIHNYREITRTTPDYASLWFETGMAAAGNLEFSLSRACLDMSVSLASNDASMLLLIGEQFQKIRMSSKARECAEKAVEADPKNIHCRLTLASYLERERRLSDAWECVEISLHMQPENSGAKYYRAFLLHRRGKNSESEAALRELLKKPALDPATRQSANHLLGVVLDALGNISESMYFFKISKSLLRATPQAASLKRTYETGARQRKELLASLSSEQILQWQREALGETNYELAFLGGHPRSGTTLIEQVLGAHPEVIAFDEPEAFTMEILNAVCAPGQNASLTSNTLQSLSLGYRNEIKGRYFKSLLREVSGGVKGRLLLDKNPSPTSALFLWLRLFPGIKVIMPLRDPRDVVISCYQQNLGLTSANVNFLSLEDTVQHYCDLMDVWLRVKSLGGFEWIETRYENMVADPEKGGRRVTEFLGREWNPVQSRFYESARDKFVFAPTYHDVTQPVHQRSVGRWHAYSEYLKPCLAKLEPYCQALGYGLEYNSSAFQVSR